MCLLSFLGQSHYTFFTYVEMNNEDGFAIGT